jgi:hypothetical protein
MTRTHALDLVRKNLVTDENRQAVVDALDVTNDPAWSSSTADCYEAEWQSSEGSCW